ncbi:fungal-specific transcription factor-like protein, partial [Xylogone sp. PMI_703]
GSATGPETATIPSAHSLAAILSPDPTPHPSDSDLSRQPSSYTNTSGSSRAFTDSTTYPQAESSYLHPNSPQQHPHSASIASPGGPAPIVFGGAGGGTDDGRGGEGRGGQEEKKPTKMVRSSIACINNGVNSVCKACQSSGRECTYPPSAAATTPRRSDSTVVKTEGEGEGKKRVRVKTEDLGRSSSHRTDEDVLDPKILTRSVWDEIYKLFRAHFSAEMPFLHPPTFRKRIFQISNPREGPPSPSDQDAKLLFLGVLTLTARFHPTLVAHHSPKTAAGSSNPQAASEYYSHALAAAFGPSCENLTRPTLETVQALLMLGLYEWSQSRGLKAWVYVGIALRLAQSMGLAFEDDADRMSPRKTQSHTPDENYAIEKECRRRTFWSCFIMDRLLSSGKFRPTMIDVKTLRVRLPCSDDQFMFGGNRMKTSFLVEQRLGYESPNDIETAEFSDDGVENRFIRLVEIFGRFSIYSHAGGRRAEKYPPWDERTEFYQLRRDLEYFHRSLPSKLTYTQANLAAHIEMTTTAATYASLHTLYFLCLIMLHREYIPFIPLRCDGPQGPLDEPTFPKDKFDTPEGFWEVSAETIFKAAKDLVDIVRTYQDRGALPESPLVGFCIWQATFVSLYAIHFPHMDVHRHLCDPAHDLDMDSDVQSAGYAAITVKLLKELAPKSRMAAGYLRIVGKMHRYFNAVRGDYHNQFKHKARPWTGGGLEEYKTLERELKEFGSIESGGDKSIPSDSSDTADPVRSRASTNEIAPSSGNPPGEPMQGVEGATPSRAWAAVNNTQMETTDRTKFVGQNHPPSGYDYTSNYQLSPRQTPPHPPSLVSGGSAADSPSGLSSPYGTHQMFHGQQAGPPQLPHQQSNAYPGMPPHTQSHQHPGQPAMAPPQGALVAVPPGFFPPDANQNLQMKEEMYWCQQESINYNSNLDNMAQMPDMDSWAQGEWSDNPNFLQVISSSPKFAFAN